MNRRMKIMLIALAILFGLVFGYKAFVNYMINKFIKKLQSPIITVSTMNAAYSTWQPKLLASGSLRAIRGVNVTTELAGMVQKIYLTPGSIVKKGDLLVQLNADVEIGTLHALQAQAALAKITYERDKAQFAVKAISKQQLDTDIQNLKNLEAQVASQAGTVAKKTITAPFDGRLGINNVNPGQYLNVGDKVSTLQALDPIWADFYMPQQTLSQIKVGDAVTVTSDTYPHKEFKGKITTIEPAVNIDTRNVLVEAAIDNPKYELKPGMFITVKTESGASRQYITLPQTAITFNPYGDLVYIVHENKEKDEKGKPILTVTQNFVVTGDTRGEQIAVVKGLKEGDVVVTSGQLKLKNGSRIAVNNTITPSNNPNPEVSNEY